MPTVQASYAIRREPRTEADRRRAEGRARQSRQSEDDEDQRRRFAPAPPRCRSIHSLKTMSLSKRPGRSSSSLDYRLRTNTKLCPIAQFVGREASYQPLRPKRILQKRSRQRRQRRGTKTKARGHSYQRMIERRTLEERQKHLGLRLKATARADTFQD